MQILLVSTCLFVLLMQHFCDVALHLSELLVDVKQELIQVRSIKLTALNQNLQGEPRLSIGLQPHLGQEPIVRCLELHSSSVH